MKRRLSIPVFITALLPISFYFYNNPILASTSTWIKITFSLMITAIFGIFYFTIAYKNLLKKFKIILIIIAIVGLIIILSLFANDLLGIERYLSNLTPETAIFLMLFFIYVSLGSAILFEKIVASSSSNRLEILYTLISISIFIITITVIYVFIPLIAGLKQYLWLGPLSAAIFVLFFILGYYLIKKTGEESKKKEDAEKLIEEWKKLAEAKDQFLLSLQHHLRTPLTPVKIYLERILDGTYGREENPVIREKLIEMKQSINSLYFLIESLLDIQELKIGREILNPEDCQIEELIKSVIEELKPQAEEKNLYLIFEQDKETKITSIKIDKKRTREALWNLIDNSVKYTKKGGVTVKLKLAETSSHLAPRSAKLSSAIENSKPQPLYREAVPLSFEKGRWLKIIVSDTGIGMAREEIESFLRGELFSRGEEAKKLFGPGRGIGLTIANEFIKAQGGRIGAESGGPGMGTTFWIELPIK